MLDGLLAWVRRRREAQALAATPAARIDPVHLRSIGEQELHRIFASATIAAEWPRVASVIEQIAEIEDMKTGGVNPGDRRALYYLVRALGARRVLEIGTNVGASTMHIAAAMKQNATAAGDDCVLVTVDIFDVNDAPDAFWRRAGLPRSPRENITLLGMAGRVRFVAMDSLQYFDRVNERFDLIFLDGDHSAATVYREIPRALDRLRDDGVVVLHDFFPGHRPLWNNGSVIYGPQLAVERLQSEGASIAARPLGALPWPTKLSSNVTSLALLSRP